MSGLAGARAGLLDQLQEVTPALDPAPQVVPEVPLSWSGPLAVVVESSPWVSPDPDDTYGEVTTRWEVVVVADRSADPATSREWLDHAVDLLIQHFGPELAETTPHLTVTHRDASFRAVRATIVTTVATYYTH